MALFNDSKNNSLSALSDEELAQLAQEDQRDAFLELYDRYLPKVYNRVKSRIPQSDAEDLTQDIFIAVVRSLPKFEQRSKFNTWLYTIVNRQIADYYRKYYRSSEQHAVSIETPEGQNLPAVGGEMADDMIVLQQALENLKDDYQEVILLRFADGLPFAEIAQQMGKSLEATKSLYRRAIQAMTEQVEQ